MSAAPDPPDAAVDILLATYNGARFLPELLASLAAQTHPGWRLVVRDDGSSDDTPRILADWAAARPDRVVLLDAEGGNLGAMRSFARLLAASDAPCFLFCDQDDVWLPEKISRLLAAMQEAEARLPAGTPILVHGDLRVVDGALAPIAPSYWTRQRFHPDRSAETGAILVQNCVTGCAMMGNAALRRAADPIPEIAPMHDWWCAVVAWRAGRIVAVPEALVLYRQHQANLLGSPGAMTPLGAVRDLLSGGPLAGRFRRSLGDRARQAQALLERFPGDPESRATRLCAELAGLERLPFLARKGFLWRHGVPTGHRVFDLGFALLA